MLAESLKNLLRTAVYPGLDLHVRNRASLCRYWMTGPRDVLDAGSGNGYFSWLAYKSGARVLALNIDQAQIDKAASFLVDFRKADAARLQFERLDLRRLGDDARRFDEIICYEALEHIVEDVGVVQAFHRVLRPGGVLHLCCPYRLHPRHQAEVLDVHGTGGHVRAGYTEDEYRQLLEPAGFRIERFVGIGSRSLYVADAVLRATRSVAGDLAALPLLPFAMPAVWFAAYDPKIPFSLYARAVKHRER